MSPAMRKRVLLILAATVAVLFIAGGFAAFLSRHNTICSDRKVPLRQQTIGLGQIQYLCHDGEIVTK